MNLLEGTLDITFPCDIFVFVAASPSIDKASGVSEAKGGGKWTVWSQSLL